MADMTAAYEKGKLYQLDLTHLQADPNQPRKFIDPQALEDLAESVRQHGVLMPVLFRSVPDSSTAHPEPVEGQAEQPALYIVAGERRCEAARKAGLATIPAIFVEGNHTEIALVENLLRQDLTPVEEAEALDRLIKERSYTQEQLGAIIGKARNTVSEILSLNRLPQEVRDACRSDATVGRKALIEIARKKQERSMTTAYNAYKAKQLKAKVTRQKKNPNDPQALFDMMDKTMTKIRSIDQSAWTDEEKANFQIALANLKIEIGNCQVL
jgi:ParB family transcriptional regulator, chromosome partitioning protein